MTTNNTTTKRLYLVQPTDASPDAVPHLVAASHPSIALASVAKSLFKVSVPTALEVAVMVAAGTAVKEA